MRKIIITVIATIFMIAPFEKAKGQVERRIISADFPTVNILTGVNGEISLGVWRFEPFFQMGGYLQIFEERIVTQVGMERPHEHYSPRFESMAIYNFGTKFKITDRDRIILGVTGNTIIFGGWGFLRPLWNQNSATAFWYPYLGYSRRESLSQRMSIELSVLLNPAWSWLGEWRGEVVDIVGIGSGIATVGVGLNYEVFTNFNLTMQLMYSRRLNVSFADWRVVPNPNGIITRNLIDFSIGIHYHTSIIWRTATTNRTSHPTSAKTKIYTTSCTPPCVALSAGTNATSAFVG